MPSSYAVSRCALAAALAFCALVLPGCLGLWASSSETPVTRTAEAGAGAFDCALATLTDLGYVVADAERDVFVRAERRTREPWRSLLVFTGSMRVAHLLTIAEVEGELRVTADREVFGSGDDGAAYREPRGPNADTLADADAVLAACSAPDAS